ncbi:ATP synthase F1 subunit epsilon [Acetobacteraceae bacterium H6797]|nr:ATP synthase F1 subunit epsilon [Acetobacteraceae bacterium H6797]
MSTFTLELVSPEKLLLSRPVEMAIIPAAEGEMGILPGHSPMIVALTGGVITVRENGKDTEKLFVMGGFAEITPSRVTVLADEVTPVAEVSKATAQTRIAEAEAAYNAAAQEVPAKREAAMDRLLAARKMAEVAQAA